MSTTHDPAIVIPPMTQAEVDAALAANAARAAPGDPVNQQLAQLSDRLASIEAMLAPLETAVNTILPVASLFLPKQLVAYLSAVPKIEASLNGVIETLRTSLGGNVATLQTTTHTATE